MNDADLGSSWQRILRRAGRAGLALSTFAAALTALELRADEAEFLRRLPPVEAAPRLLSTDSPVEGVTYPEMLPWQQPQYFGAYVPSSAEGIQLMSAQTALPAAPEGAAQVVWRTQSNSLQEPLPPPQNSEEKASNGDAQSDNGNAAGTANGNNNNGEPQTYGQQPVNNSLQFLRQQSVLLDPGAWQVDTGLVYTLFDNDFPLPFFDNNGNVAAVAEGHVRRRLLYTPLAARYGLSCNVQTFAILPVGYSNTQVSTVGLSDSLNSGGIGDLTAGTNLHLCRGEDEKPDVIGTFSFTAPTGKFGTPLFGLAPGSNLGQGFWALSAQLLAIHRYDPIIVFYGGGYRHLFAREFDGAFFAPGEQINYTFGVGFSVNDRVTLSTALQGFYITNTLIDQVSVPGTNIEPISLRFAATIARRSRILEPFAVIGMTDFAPSASLGLTVTFY